MKNTIILGNYLKKKIKQKINKELKEINKENKIVEKIIVDGDKLFLIGHDLRSKSYGGFKRETLYNKESKEEDMYEPLNIHQKFKKNNKE